MQKLTIVIFSILYFGVSNGQSGFTLEMPEKKNYTLKRESDRLGKDYIVIDDDTLVNINNNLKITDLELFCQCFGNKEFNTIYKQAVQFEFSKDKKIGDSKQWNSEIKVYLDKSIPNTIKQEFADFFKQIESIDNFKISFTNSISNSNYLIKVSDTTIPDINSNNFENAIDNPYSRVTYNLIHDNNNKLYSGILLIDKSVVNMEDLALKKLKQFFFMSLGPFYNRTSLPSESLLGSSYVGSDFISQFDLKILRTHYYKIYPKSFSILDLLKMNKKAKNICNNE